MDKKQNLNIRKFSSKSLVMNLNIKYYELER